MIFFKKIRWKNFLSTGNTFTEIDYSKNNTTLIVGENGAGKSTMLDALSFVLYNKPFRRVNKPQLLNSINKKDLVVEIEFNIGSHMYKIVRGLKPSIFEVYQNNNLINQDAETKDYQEVLEKQILKLNHKSFCQVVVLGSASFVPFMQLTAQNRRDVIEDLLDIQIFSTMNSLLKDKISSNNTKLLEVEYQYDLTSEKIKMQHEHIVAMQKNSEEQIEKLKKELKDYTDFIEREKNEIETIDEQILSLRASIEDQEQINKKQKTLQRLDIQLSDKISKLQADIEFFTSHDSCPTCKQDIDNAFKCETVDAKQAQIQETQQGIEKLKEEITTIQEKIQQIADVSSKISSLNIDKITRSNSITGLVQQCKKIAKEIKDLQDKSDDLIMNDDKMKELEDLLDKQREEKTELLKDKDALNISSIILKDNGIKARIIKQYVPVINKLINKYLAAMDFFVNFELNENFEETIKSRFRDEFSYASFSEGEKMRINLAILFTWRAVAKLRNSASTNLLIMDEVLDEKHKNFSRIAA